MTCSRRSTTWRAERAAAGLGLLLAWLASGVVLDARTSDDARAAAAIREAVAQRLGPEARIEVMVLSVQIASREAGGTEPLVATLDPAARAGARMRVGLVVPREARRLRVGQAEAIVRVVTRHARARVPLARGATIDAASVEQVSADIGSLPLRPLPHAVEGGRVLRPIGAGEIIASAAVSLPPLVRSGATVIVRVVGPGLDVRGRAVAAQSGELGDRIRVVNPESGRAFEGRIVGPGEIEVRHGG
jgi:flagellar basal body P-ring formation protein FlgA